MKDKRGIPKGYSNLTNRTQTGNAVVNNKKKEDKHQSTK